MFYVSCISNQCPTICASEFHCIILLCLISQHHQSPSEHFDHGSLAHRWADIQVPASLNIKDVSGRNLRIHRHRIYRDIWIFDRAVTLITFPYVIICKIVLGLFENPTTMGHRSFWVSWREVPGTLGQNAPNTVQGALKGFKGTVKAQNQNIVYFYSWI